MKLSALSVFAGPKFSILFFVSLVSCGTEARQADQNVFVIEHELTLPGTTETVYDAITGDISGWWDHSYSDKPAKFYIEPKPGGGFYEIFNDSGDGVLHATVIFAHRGKMLRFDGPLGLSGRAVTMVHTYILEPAGQDSTVLKLSVHASGEIDSDVAKTVDGVWKHFLFERLKPYMESGKRPLTK